ncbi:zeatin O-glucosyltransferase-like [Hibiscus syriacus]|uniref:Zeatin O-glucosyltransferase-like n=1 Tax=Hibiscus syriacus TaxID=106335 RepID=A0A6A3CJW8_HIBSY|nr:uncharacterized protein LOC120185039 [Hibiscus syriacus]KAE8729096.1 zeatin O-glucosyltransferase-like [Hibiscus syriacus]
MAQFTTQGRLKLLFHGDGVEPRDPFHYKLLSIVFGGSAGLKSLQLQKGMFRFLGSTPRKHHFSSLKKRTKFNAKASLDVSDEGIHDDDDYDSELEIDELACFRGLVLDISYRPINVVCWRRAICLEFMEKADVLEYYDQTVNSPSGSFNIPAVLRIPHLLQVVKRRRISTNLSRKNVLFRDNFTCQYCRSRDNLTIDHVLPIARGGEWTWENLVTACAKCNSKKGRKTPEEANMTLIKVPKAPKDYDILAIPLTSAAVRMLRMRNGTPEEWQQYLSSSMEP